MFCSTACGLFIAFLIGLILYGRKQANAEPVQPPEAAEPAPPRRPSNLRRPTHFRRSLEPAGGEC